MAQARAGHTATLLADGSVLIVGGFQGGEQEAVGLVERYREGAGVTEVGTLAIARQSHSATRLRDGRVLIAGGWTAEGATASAELYDPATHGFSPAEPMREPRAEHTATLLADGRVLIAGGVGPGVTFLTSAELFDPRTNAFSATGKMNVARDGGTASLLLDGRVLLAGGHHGRHTETVVETSAELYDPTTGTFLLTGSLAKPRHKHDAVRLADGRVLIVAGADVHDDLGTYASTEFYDPATGRFAAGPTLRHARYKLEGTSFLLADARVLVAGGAADAEILDVRTGSSELLGGAYGSARLFSAAALLPTGGAVLVVGGYSGSGVSASAWLVSV